MANRKIKNIGASVRERLLQLAKHQGVDFNRILLLFRHRNTAIADVHYIFKTEFYNDDAKERSWTAFFRKSFLKKPALFADVLQEIQAFLSPILEAIAKNHRIARKWSNNSKSWN